MWLYTFLIIGVLCGYFSLVLIWSVLGAILHPTAYLYYATSAFTLVAFVTLKIREMKAAQDRGIQYLMEIIDRKLKDMVDFVLRRMLGSLEGISGNAKSAVSLGLDIAMDPHALLQDKIVGFISTTPVGKRIRAAGFEINMIIKIARGDYEELTEFVTRRGIPRYIAEGLVGVIRGKITSVIDNLKSLASHPVIGIPEPLIETFVNLIVNPSHLNVKKTVNELALSIFDIMEKRLPKGKLPHS